MATTLNDKTVGSIVKLKVGGVVTDFIIVHKGRPSTLYDASCDGAWLMMKDIYNFHTWSDRLSDFSTSGIKQYLNSDFLALFESYIQNTIKTVKIPYFTGGTSGVVYSGSSGASCKVFLLSMIEAGCQYWIGSTPEYRKIDGEKLDYFIEGSDKNANDRRIAYKNGVANSWWSRSLSEDKQEMVCQINTSGSNSSKSGYGSTLGVRPLLILPLSTQVSDDSSIGNTAPSAPSTITVPSKINGGDVITISWSPSTDAEGNLEGYELDRVEDRGVFWTNIYKGPLTTTTNLVEFGNEFVKYRVRAYDSDGAYSAYKVSDDVPVINNTPPTIISPEPDNSNLGKKTEGFEVSYYVSDFDFDTVTVTVTEAIDSTVIRTFNPELDQNQTFQVTGETFMKIVNGSHKMTITADDGIDTTTYTLYFEKEVTKATITMNAPMNSYDPITICVLSISGKIPSDAKLKVEVTNNAKDSEVKWEDCTNEVKHSANHIFENNTAVNGFSFNFRISVERGESGESGYITSVQGGFQ